MSRTSEPSPPTTGWPPSELMQDDCRKLSRWLSNRPDARLHAREAAAAIEQTRLHRMGHLNQGRDCEECREQSCYALGLDPADPLAWLSRPWVRFATVAIGAAAAAALIVQGVTP